MKPVLTVFIDGLKADSLHHMPFLNSFPHKRRLQTVLGYSITAHATMYSGVYPDKHYLWFLWQYAPHSSPFRWLKRAHFLTYFNSLPMWLLLHKITSYFVKYTAYWGIPRLINLPLKYWPNIDVSEKKYWDETGYLGTYQTIFELLRQHHIQYDVVGMVKGTFETSRIVAEYQFSDIKPWTYLFIGDVDYLTHHHGQESSIMIEKLHWFDDLIKRCYHEFKAKAGDFEFFVFSDHGHVQINEKINLYELFRQSGENLDQYMHLIDANFARFWFKNDMERKTVEKILSKLKNGFILTDEDMEHWHVSMPDTRYGELIFYLDAGSGFSYTNFGYGRNQNSAHGYLPSHPECDGIFVSSHAIAQENHVTLVDILPSLLNLLNLPIPSNIDGHIIWG